MIESRYNCPYCNRPIKMEIDRAFSPVPQDEVDHDIRQPTMAQLEQRARANGADPDRMDYSQCADYRSEDQRFEQTGAGWAEPPEETEEPVLHAFDLARQLLTTWLDGRDLQMALADVDRKEAAANANA